LTKLVCGKLRLDFAAQDACALVLLGDIGVDGLAVTVVPVDQPSNRVQRESVEGLDDLLRRVAVVMAIDDPLERDPSPDHPESYSLVKEERRPC